MAHINHTIKSFACRFARPAPAHRKYFTEVQFFIFKEVIK